jgi:hypothetical protein
MLTVGNLLLQATTNKNSCVHNYQQQKNKISKSFLVDGSSANCVLKYIYIAAATEKCKNKKYRFINSDLVKYTWMASLL